MKKKDVLGWLHRLATVQKKCTEQLGHVITRVSDIENKRGATAAGRAALFHRVYISQDVLAHLALATQEGSCHIFQRLLWVHVNVQSVVENRRLPPNFNPLMSSDFWALLILPSYMYRYNRYKIDFRFCWYERCVDIVEKLLWSNLWHDCKHHLDSVSMSDVEKHNCHVRNVDL